MRRSTSPQSKGIAGRVAWSIARAIEVGSRNSALASIESTSTSRSSCAGDLRAWDSRWASFSLGTGARWMTATSLWSGARGTSETASETGASSNWKVSAPVQASPCSNEETAIASSGASSAVTRDGQARPTRVAIVLAPTSTIATLVSGDDYSVFARDQPASAVAGFVGDRCWSGSRHGSSSEVVALCTIAQRSHPRVHPLIFGRNRGFRQEMLAGGLDSSC